MRSTCRLRMIVAIGAGVGIWSAVFTGPAVAQGPGGVPGAPVQRAGGGRAQAGASLGVPGAPMSRMGRGGRLPIGANSSLPQSRSSGMRMSAGANSRFLPAMPGMGGAGVGVMTTDGLKANAVNAGRGAGLGIPVRGR